MKKQKQLSKMTVPELITKLEKEQFHNGQRNAAWFQHALGRLEKRLRDGNATFASQFGGRIMRLSHRGDS